MREDFVAELDPYARYVPTRFANRYRLDLLTVDQALEAVIHPARDAGVEFEEEAAAKLVDDLRRVRAQRGAGVVEELGRHVEPVQLQVGCRQMWDGLGDASTIGIDDIESVGDVNEALASTTPRVSRRRPRVTGVPERALRDWFERELVTAQGFRGQVLGGPDAAAEAGGRVLELLTDAHLLRAESRRGAVWYELAHDRLTQPIAEDNARWREDHSVCHRATGQRVGRTGRPDRLLVVGPELDEALRWERDPVPRPRASSVTTSRRPSRPSSSVTTWSARLSGPGVGCDCRSASWSLPSSWRRRQSRVCEGPSKRRMSRRGAHS